MAPSEAAFDPYFKWLGIRAKEQPPDHYRLLGLETFESDADVIATAADARMLHLKTFQTGKHAPLSQRLLNEIAAAKVCLLNPEKKAEYDRALREKIAAEQVVEPPPPPPRAGPPALPAAAASPPAGGPGTPSLVWKFAVLGAVAVALLIGIATLLLLSDRAPQVARPVVTEPPKEVPPVSKPPDETGQQGPAGPPLVTVRPKADSANPVPPAVAPSPPVDPAGSPKKPDMVGPQVDTSGANLPKSLPDAMPLPEHFGEPKAEDAASGESPPPAGKPKPQRVGPPGVAQGPPKRLPVPDEAAQKAVEKELRSDLSGEIGRAKRPEDKLALAEKLFVRGIKGESDPTVRYVLLRMACDTAIAAGELSRTLEAIDEIARSYDIDPLDAKLDLLARTAGSSRALPGFPVTALEWTEAAVLLTDEALASGKPEAAEEGARLIRVVGKKARAPQLAAVAAAKEKAIEPVRQEREAFQKAEKTLAEDPENPAANYTVGGWHCFVRNDWQRGLPHLARCERAELREVAQRELQDPSSPAEQYRLGAAWFKLADAETRYKPPMMARAAHWLRRLKEGLVVAPVPQIDKLLADIIPHLPPWIDKQGAVRPGVNVALAANAAQASSRTGSAAGLNDGVIPLTVAQSGMASASSVPCEWVVTLSQVFRLREIRVKFPEGKGAAYVYSLETSADGVNFRPLVSPQQGAGWQVFRFLPRPVKAIKLVGHLHAGPMFYVSELEAYTPGPPPSP